MTVLRNVPMPRVTASVTTWPASSSTSGFSTIFSCPRSTPPMSRPISGMNTSFTREVVILPNAVPMITPTAISMTLPRMANSLNSAKNFFMCKSSYTKSIITDNYYDTLSVQRYQALLAAHVGL